MALGDVSLLLYRTVTASSGCKYIPLQQPIAALKRVSLPPFCRQFPAPYTQGLVSLGEIYGGNLLGLIRKGTVPSITSPSHGRGRTLGLGERGEGRGGKVARGQKKGRAVCVCVCVCVCLCVSVCVCVRVWSNFPD